MTAGTLSFEFVGGQGMHELTRDMEVLQQAIVRYSVERVRMDPPELDSPRTPEELWAMAGQTITDEGLGGLEALRLFTDVLAPACISTDHPKFLAFVPAAPTEAATLFDLIVGASSICGTSWLESAGATYAENQALKWIADLAYFGPEAGGTFVSGGTAGNLSALVVARHKWRRGSESRSALRGLVISSKGAHASIKQATYVMDVDLLEVGGDRLTGEQVAEAIEGLNTIDRERLFAIACTAGTTNLGIIDDLSGIGQISKEQELWMHVDGAYGGAGLAAPSVRDQFSGIELADSFIVDPHKWLFAPFDCCALIYQNPELAREAHQQQGAYLEAVYDGVWNSSDYAHHLSRRARGLPLWFSLATHGTQAYEEAVEQTLMVARDAATRIQNHPDLELVTDQSLSICVFRRIGWKTDDYKQWSNQQLEQGDSFVTPTKYKDETVLRFCIVNPRTTVTHIEEILASL